MIKKGEGRAEKMRHSERENNEYIYVPCAMTQAQEGAAGIPRAPPHLAEAFHLQALHTSGLPLGTPRGAQRELGFAGLDRDRARS
jgi:hypothetical protein